MPTPEQLDISMVAPPPFTDFPKIARLSRECVITEKIDGTNASIYIADDLNPNHVVAGSRNGWITRDNDNFGFAKWVYEHTDELIAGLGAGHHFGEWWGSGIQRRYGLKEKRFSLFNTHRWTEENKPACCHIVPVLFTGMFDTAFATLIMSALEKEGSLAAPGFMKPEGIVIYHTAARIYFKKTIEKDSEWKGKSNE